MTPPKRGTRGRVWSMVTAAAIVLAATVVVASPAAANSGGLSGQGYNGTTYYGSTARINSHGKNEVRFQYTGTTPGGGSAHIYLVQGVNGYVYWDAVPSLNTWYTTTYRPTGSVVWPNGTFYVAWKLSNQCGGSGCGLMTWTGNIQWNLMY